MTKFGEKLKASIQQGAHHVYQDANEIDPGMVGGQLDLNLESDPLNVRSPKQPALAFKS